MDAGVGFDTGLDPERAAGAACGEALAGLGGAPDLVLLFATAAWGAEVERVVAAARARVGGAAFLGATTRGLFGREQAAEERPAVGCMALSGVEAEAFWVDPDLREGGEIADELERQVSMPPAPQDWLLVLHGTRSLPLPAALAGLAAFAPGCALAGIGASPLPRGRTRVWSDDECGLAGLAGVVVRAPTRLSLHVTRPRLAVGGPYTVTRCNGPWVLELDGEPAMEAFRACAGERLAADLRRASQHLAVALGPEPGPEGVHPIVGFHRETGSFSLPGSVECGTLLGFVAREGGSGREDLDRMLAGAPTAQARAGLYLGCRSRGSGLFGDADLEPALVRRSVEAPLLGVQGNVQLLRESSLTNSAVLALLS